MVVFVPSSQKVEDEDKNFLTLNNDDREENI